MPIVSDLRKVIEITGARALQDSDNNFLFEGLEFDSREVRAGQLFIALPGEKNHGNNFVNIALQNGASLVVADSEHELNVTEGKERVLLVRDPLKSLWDLAVWWRKELSLPTLAITGSVGKTTCKEIAAGILSQLGKGTYSLKSHNNHVGVPYTICRSSKEDLWMVLEIGMNHRGEISELTKIALPDVCVISTIAPAHIGNLGTIDAIMEEKLDIVEGLKKDGTLIVDSSNIDLVEKARKRLFSKDFNLEMFGQDHEEVAYVSNIESQSGQKFQDGLGIKFKIFLGSAWHEVGMNIVGKHNALNVSCVVRACLSLFPSLSKEAIITGLNSFSAPVKRLDIKHLCNGSIIIDDCYNANPTSMESSINILFDMAEKDRKIGLVLGDMLELGEFSDDYHRQISSVIFKKRPDFLVAVGDKARFYLSSFNGGNEEEVEKYKHFYEISEAKEFLLSQNFDIVLVKASRGMCLEVLVNELLSKYPVVNS